MFILTTLTSSPRSLAISSTTGATIRQGPHHGAQKSTSTGTSDSMTSAWKLLSVTSETLPAIEGSLRVWACFKKYSADGAGGRIPFAEMTDSAQLPAAERRTGDPTNGEIAAALDELGDLYELDGAVVHRIVAYRNAAKAVRDASVSVSALAR